MSRRLVCTDEACERPGVKRDQQDRWWCLFHPDSAPLVLDAKGRAVVAKVAAGGTVKAVPTPLERKDRPAVYVERIPVVEHSESYCETAANNNPKNVGRLEIPADIPAEATPPDRQCLERDCDQPATLRGLCRKHYDRGRARQGTSRGPKSRRDKVVETRARSRATSRLVKTYSEAYGVFYAEELDLALQEAQEVANAAPGHDHAPRLRPGPASDATLTERIRTVGECGRCQSYHDRGHRCAACGRAEGDLAEAG